MSDRQYGILVVEDDFRIADIHRAFIEKSEGFYVVGMARNGSEAKALMAEHAANIQLILLDAYLPDVEGLELLWAIRRDYVHVDIVMVTAAREVETISEALRGGVFDYLIKPIEAARMTQMLTRFRREREALANRAEMNQDELDSVLARLKPGEPLRAKSQSLSQALPKGIDRLTLRRVIDALADAPDSLTAMQMARIMGASRSTARRYLEFLVAEQAVSAELGYGDVGRPERRYRLLKTAHDWLDSL
ncbi:MULTISPECIES: response regulator [Halomonadaceae]|uniref:Transcriptional regulatory protein n=2 Tax=Vreelandella TaxID=3137766 RepID=A0A7Z0LS27_9GAMM|nr:MULTISPECIES: response regulator [Halomonas]AJY48862.1 response regulator receiver and unknown domain protein [Halomonas sp. KO116]NYS77531.1 response regulator [Halomonas glaciei]|tara:strand:- start:94 stop:837 length:744 start_codon:yes stop_codon:yes gene_type:complete